jgi:hypothetical protein
MRGDPAQIIAMITTIIVVGVITIIIITARTAIARSVTLGG